MNIQQKIDESQKRTQLTNMINIDWQYAVQIIPFVLPLIVKEQTNYNEIKNECKILYDLFSNIENNIKELKDMIPTE